ncbi:MAG: FG-GAP-like repeat-containing protein [Candidatus Zixiibacteriota bacterium]
MPKIYRILVSSSTAGILAITHFAGIVHADPSCTAVASTAFVSGVSVAGAGDVNADGYADIIISSTSNGSTEIISGKTGATIFEIVSTKTQDQFGAAVASVADLNGDGIPDILIGAPTSTDVFQFAGRVDVFDGQTGAFVYSVFAPSPGALFGASVAGVGDINGDGFGDFIVGAPENHIRAIPPADGDAYVFSGVDGSVIFSYAGDTTHTFGRAVAGVGDVDNDGIPDFAIGTGAIYSGSVSVYSGATGSLLHKLLAQAEIEQFGAAVSTAGDVNLDGYVDILVGAPNSSVTGPVDGQAYVFSGQTGGLLFALSPDTSLAPFSYEFSGHSVAGGQDIDGDGVTDLVIGAMLAGNDAGKAYVFSGADQSRIAVIAGQNTGERLGFDVTLAGDVNGDCLGDVALASKSATFVYMFQNSCSHPAACAGCCNVPGDANNDGTLNIADVTFGIARVFSGGAAPACADEADPNGDNKVNIADVTFLITRIFAGGRAPVCGTTGV